MKLFTLIMFVVFLGQGTEGRRVRRVDLPLALSEKINEFLIEAVNFHGDLVDFSKDQARIRSRVDRVSQKAKESLDFMASSPHLHKVHLQKLFPLMLTHLEMFKESSGTPRSKALSGFFRTVVEIVRTYEVDQHRIFFCSKDKNIWIQNRKRSRSWRPQNPINREEYKNCGAYVR